MKRYLLFIVVLLTIVSCASLKDQVNPVNQNITIETLKSIEGKYSILTMNGGYLPGILIDNYHFNNDNPPDEKDYVELVFLKNKSFEIKIFDNDSIIKQKQISGKIKDGCFEYSITQISPFWVIINGFHNAKNRIFINESGNTSIDYAQSHIALFIILPFTGDKIEKENIEIQRITTANKEHSAFGTQSNK